MDITNGTAIAIIGSLLAAWGVYSTKKQTKISRNAQAKPLLVIMDSILGDIEKLNDVVELENLGNRFVNETVHSELFLNKKLSRKATDLNQPMWKAIYEKQNFVKYGGGTPAYGGNMRTTVKFKLFETQLRDVRWELRNEIRCDTA